MDWEGGFSTNSPEFLMLDGDMEEFRSEKSVKAGKSPEEIQRLMVDEDLSDIERACLLLRTGQDVQKACVIGNLPDLLRSQQMDTLCKVVPKLHDTLPSASAEVQISASKAFQEIIEKELIPTHIFTTSFLPMMLSQLESRDTSVSASWLATLLSSIPHLPKDVIKGEILNIAVANGQLSQTVSSRQASCQIIGKMASKFEPFWLKRELLPLATTLCQDVDMEVRQCMCRQLDRLARALGVDLAMSTIFPELIELTNDEECGVRIAGVETLTELISFLNEETLRSNVVPLMKKFCKQALLSGDSSLPVVARLLGRLCHELKDVMTSEQQMWFIDFYHKLSQYSPKGPSYPNTPSTLSLITPSTADEGMEAECKRLCAYNFPAMLLFTGSAAFKSELSSTFKGLAEDESVKVRRSIASGFHEVAKILETNCLCVAAHYQRLLKDSSVEVLLALVAHLADVMELFAEAANLAPDTRQPGLLEFIPALLSCEQVASKCRQWRLHEELLKQLSSLVHCMTSDQLYSKFVPLTFKCITGNYVLPVKLAAGRTLCHFIRHIRRAEQRQELCTRIVEECAKSASCRIRLLFIEICHFFLDIFSRSFFKKNFFEAVMRLAQDPVVNVRLRLCRLLPKLKAILKLPGDRALLQQLEQTVRKLISQERDPDASQAVRDAVLELDRIEVAMEMLTRRTFFEADLIDQQREDEERQLVLVEEREKEGSNGGGRGKEGGEGRKSSLKCSPGISKALLGKKGKGGKSPSVGRKSGSTPSLVPLPTTPTTTSPSTQHRIPGVIKAKGSTTPTSIRKTLSSPPATSCEPSGGGGGGEGGGTRGGSPAYLTPGSPRTVRHTAVPLRQKSVDRKSSPQSSPSSSHTGKTVSSRSTPNSSPGSMSKLTISQSKDGMSQSASKGLPNSVPNRKKAQQYGTAAYSSGKGGSKRT